MVAQKTDPIPSMVPGTVSLLTRYKFIWCLHVQILDVYMHTHICTHMYVYAYLHVCVWVRACVRMYTCVHACAYVVYACACVYVRVQQTTLNGHKSDKYTCLHSAV